MGVGDEVKPRTYEGMSIYNMYKYLKILMTLINRLDAVFRFSLTN